jgi:hypothetical protein
MERLHWPLFSIDARKRVSAPFPPEQYARLEDEAGRADMRGRLGPFVARLAWRFVSLDFLSTENREFIESILRELGRPWGPVDLLDAIIGNVRREVRAGRMRLGFWAGQVEKIAKAGAR